MKKIIKLLFLMALFSSCQPDQIMTYSGENAIFINEYITAQNNLGPDPGISDSSLFTLRSYDNGSFLDTLLVIRVQGVPSDIDRPYVLQVDAANSNAVAERDYSMLEEDYSISAGSTTDTVNIRFFNNETLLDTLKRLVFTVQPNSYFTTSFDSYFVAETNTTISRIRHSFVFGDVALEPSFWEPYESFLGTFSARKVALLIEIAGLEERLIYDPFITQYDRNDLVLAARAVQTYLNEQAAIGNVILDEDGRILVMGETVQ